MKEIYFDMDGTLADFYSEKNWLQDILTEKTTAYKNAQPLLNMRTLARTLNKLTKQGYNINIVSWLPQGASQTYNNAVDKVKRQWIKQHLKSVTFARIDILPYGEPKQNGRYGILFDDEEQNRTTWHGLAFKETEIMTVLKKLS